MELETVLYRVEGNVGIVSLNRTKAMNSLNKQIFADLTTAFEEAKKDDTVRCVIMNGEGRAFAPCGDIAEMKGITTEEAFFDFMTVAGEFTTLLNTFPKPVIAAPTAPSPAPAPPWSWLPTSLWWLTTPCSSWPSARWA